MAGMVTVTLAVTVALMTYITDRTVRTTASGSLFGCIATRSETFSAIRRTMASRTTIFFTIHMICFVVVGLTRFTRFGSNDVSAKQLVI